MYSGQIRPTVEYDRKIRYLDYMENGQRSRGAGFVKLERRDEHCNISLQISGLYRKDHFTRPLLLIGGGGERELCKLQLADGGLKLYLEKLDSHNLDGQGMDYEQLKGLRIPISEGKEIQCLWEGQESRRRASAASGQETPGQDMPVGRANGEPDREQNKETTVMKNKEAATGNLDTEGREPAMRNSGIEDREPAMGNSGIEDRERVMKNPDMEDRKPTVGTSVRGTWNPTDKREESNGQKPTEHDPAEWKRLGESIGAAQTEYGSDSERPSEPEEVSSVTVFKEDKWDQLWSIYPHICPFSDEREYLSLGPGDFVMLPGRYYKLVNNSFLLHGYYNYHHLILTRVRHRDNVRYYIGVPGNLYQKEKKIAIMFGFESFECAAEPAGEGDFGYYLIPVEL